MDFPCSCFFFPWGHQIVTIMVLRQFMQRNARVILAGVGVAQSAERATPYEEVVGSITAVAARSLLVESVSV